MSLWVPLKSRDLTDWKNTVSSRSALLHAAGSTTLGGDHDRGVSQLRYVSLVFATLLVGPN